ncbi:MAG: SGNH/GDSL hydrolase family protein [Desulfomonilaceae bacterium]
MKKIALIVAINAAIIGGLFITAELTFRGLLFSKLPFMEGFREPGFYADWYSSDDAWKLHYMFGHWSGPKHPDPLLGWVNPSVQVGTYKHLSAKNIGSKRPALIYGDSFAEGFDSQFIEGAKAFPDSCGVVNYGVSGYGVDQIFLLYKNSVGQYKNPIVIICILDEDLDRSFLTVRDGPKPYFKMDNSGFLKLCGVPVFSDPGDFFLTHPPEIMSYLLAAAFRLSTGVYKKQESKNLSGGLMGELINETQIVEQKKRINQAILLELIKDLRSRRLTHVFLLFESATNFFKPHGWRMRCLEEVLHSQEEPYIAAREVIEGFSTKDTYTPLSFMSSPRDFHPSSLYFRLVGEKLAEMIVSFQK